LSYGHRGDVSLAGCSSPRTRAPTGCAWEDPDPRPAA